MKLKIFTVHDSKAEAFLSPFFSQTAGTAIRAFEQAANEAGHDFSLHGGDYTLFEVGDFDQLTAKFLILPTPINLGLAITFIKASGPRPLEAVEN